MSALTSVRASGAGRPTFVEDDDSILIHSPLRITRSDSEEFVIPMQRFHFIQNYFTFSPPKATESIELSLDGRNIKIIGISEEESLEEFKKAFGDLIHPVVRNTELAAVIDRFLEEELIRQFEALMPRMPSRGLGLNAPILKLNEDEASQVYLGLNRCSAGIALPGELREAIETIPDARLKRALLSMSDPIITSNEIEQAQEAMKIRKLQRSFMKFIRPEVQPEALKQMLAELPEEYREHFRGMENVVQKRIDVFHTLIGDFTAIHTMEFVLGEELNKRILKNLPIQWRLPKENVMQFQSLLEYQMIGAKAKESAAVLGPSGDLVFLGRNESADAERLLGEFREIKDYYLSEKIFPRILPFTNMSLHSFPRIERIKQAFRAYFPIENLLKFVNGEMVAYCERIRRELSPEGRDQLGDELEAAKTIEEKLIVLRQFHLPEFHCEPAEMEVFVNFLTIFVPKINEVLMSTVEPDDDPYGLKAVTGEMHQYYARIKADLSPLCIEQLIERIEGAGALSDKVAVLGEFPLPEHHFSSKDLKIMASFLPLVLGAPLEEPVEELLDFEVTIHDELILLETNARRGLDTSCGEAQLLVTFMQQGREISLGSRQADLSEVANIMHKLEMEDREDEIPDSYPNKAVLVGSDDEWEDDL